MYRSGSTSYLDVLLGVSSFDDFATVWDTLNNLNERDADLVTETKTTKAELESAKKELDEQEAIAKQAYDEAASYKASVESQVEEYEALYNSLNDEYKELLEKEEQERREAAARAAAAYNPTGGSSSSTSSSSSSKDDDDSGSSSSSSSSGSGGGSDAVSRARACLGLPYVWAAVGPNSYDCSGLVGYCLTGRHERIYVARNFWAMPAVSDPQPGDVVACNYGHCALYIGNGQMIEAPYPGGVVCVSPLRGGKIVRP